MTKKIAFISYPVTNLQKSIVFYRDLLGLKLLFVKDSWAEFKIDDQRLAIHEEKDGIQPDNKSGATVYFEADPIEDAVESLQSKGVIFHGEIENYSYGKIVLFSDPDNNSIGLYEPPAKGAI